MRYHLVGRWRVLDVGGGVLLFRLRVRHDASQIRVLDIHVGICGRHNGSTSQALAQLCRQL